MHSIKLNDPRIWSFWHFCVIFFIHFHFWKLADTKVFCCLWCSRKKYGQKLLFFFSLHEREIQLLTSVDCNIEEGISIYWSAIFMELETRVVFGNWLSRDGSAWLFYLMRIQLNYWTLFDWLCLWIYIENSLKFC